MSIGILLNLLSSGIWVLAGFGLRILYEQLFWGRKARSMLRLGGSSRQYEVIVASIDPEQTAVYQRPATGLGELMAVSHLNDAIQRAYWRRGRRLHVSLSKTYYAQALSRNVIVVGGPLHNEVGRQMLDSYDQRFVFEVSQLTEVVDMQTSERYRPLMQDVRDRTDFAIISRVENRYSPGAFTLVLAGAHTYGVSAAGRMFTRDYVATLYKAAAGLGPTWQILLRVQCVDADDFPVIIGVATIEKSRGDLRP